jgi:hypothetical protein
MNQERKENFQQKIIPVPENLVTRKKLRHYNKHMAASNSPSREDYLRRKRNRRLLRYGIILAISALFVGGVSYVSRLPKFTISEIRLSGGVLVTEEEVSASALQYLHGSYLWIFPVGNALWYPRSDLQRYLKESFSRIDTIDTHLENSHTLIIDITEKQPVATWCGTNPPEAGAALDSLPQCYFMDSSSVIFAPAPNFSGDAYFTYYGPVDGDPIGRSYIASTTEFAGLADLVQVARKLSLRPQYLVAKGEGQYSLVVSGGAEILFDTEEPLSAVAENLEALLKNQIFASSTSKDLPVEYIDLRFGNKLYYKLKS